MASELSSFKRARREAAYNGQYADVVFIVGQNSEPGSPGGISGARRFPVTRALFAMASDTFEKMLFREDSNLEFQRAPSEVYIPDVSPETFDHLSRHVHELDPGFAECNVLGVLRAGDKYQMPLLIHECKVFVSKLTKAGGLDVCMKLLVSVVALRNQYGPLPDVVAHIVAYLQEAVAVTGPGFLEHELAQGLSLDLIKGILASPQLVAGEESVWEAVLIWSQRHADANGGTWQEVAYKLSDGIRFNDMQPEYFVENVVGCGVLSKDEIINIQSHWLHPGAIRAVAGHLPPRRVIQVKASYGVTRNGSNFATHGPLHDPDGTWKSAVFFHTPAHGFKLEIVCRCDVYVHGPRFMIGLTPLDVGQMGRTLRLEEGMDFKESLEKSGMYAPVLNCFGFTDEPFRVPGVGGIHADGELVLPEGAHITMAYTCKPVPKLSFRVDSAEQGIGRDAFVKSRQVPPSHWVPCLMLHGAAMSVDVVGLPEAALDMA